MAAWQHVRAILALPFMVLLVIPSVLLSFGGADTLGLWQRYPLTRIILPIAGGLLLIMGLSLMFITIRMFVLVGKGTLAPWNPTQRLVVRGIYRHVRNPMITGVCLVLLGETLTSASVWLLGWTAIFVVSNLIYIPLFEEPDLVQRFGDDYIDYRRHVPRWIPQWTAWQSAAESPSHTNDNQNQ